MLKGVSFPCTKQVQVADLDAKDLRRRTKFSLSQGSRRPFASISRRKEENVTYTKQLNFQ